MNVTAKEGSINWLNVVKPFKNMTGNQSDFEISKRFQPELRENASTKLRSVLFFHLISRDGGESFTPIMNDGYEGKPIHTLITFVSLSIIA